MGFDMNDKQICEICGKAATEEVWDIEEDTKDGDGVRHYRQIKPSHKFCAEHTRESITYNYGD